MNVVREPVQDEPEPQEEPRPSGFLPVRNYNGKLVCMVNHDAGIAAIETSREMVTVNFKTHQLSIDTPAAYLQLVYENGEFQLQQSYPNN